jgi:hypothetical protein
MSLPCELCFSEPQDPTRDDSYCGICGDWMDRWDSWSPEEREAELKTLAEYHDNGHDSS